MGEALLTRAGGGISNKSSGINDYTYTEEVLLYSGSFSGSSITGSLSEPLSSFIGVKLEASGYIRTANSSIVSASSYFNLGILCPEYTGVGVSASVFADSQTYTKFNSSPSIIYIMHINDRYLYINYNSGTTFYSTTADLSVKDFEIVFNSSSLLLKDVSINIYGLK